MVGPMNEMKEQIADHAWAWADVMAWVAGTAGEMFSVLSQRCYQLEQKLRPY